LSACTTWRSLAPTAVGGPDAEDRPSSVRVITTSGEEAIVRQPFVLGDSLHGVVESGPVSYAVTDLHAVQVAQTDEARTAAAVWGGAVVVGTVVGAVLVAVMFGDLLTDIIEG
jgi:hypothetical protein